MKKIKIALLGMWLLLWVIAGIEHFYYGKEMSVWSATLLLTLLFLAYNVHKGLNDQAGSFRTTALGLWSGADFEKQNLKI